MAASIKQAREFMAALQSINSGSAQGKHAVGLDGAAIKKKVAQFYDEHVLRNPTLWNWGMHREELHEEIASQIHDYDKCAFDGYSEQLYYYVLRQVPSLGSTPRRVLEVGCGSGFGLNFLSRLEPESSFVGLDLSSRATHSANVRFSRRGRVRYLQGDAEQLPFPEQEFDAVINVESSHNYPDLGRFYAEVARVLRPGGHFSYVDMFTQDRLGMTQQARTEHDIGLQWLKDEDISDVVRAAIARRIEPGSGFREFLRKSVKLPLRLVMEPIVMRAIGADFIGYDSGVSMKLMRRISKPTMLFESYRHGLAVKAGGKSLERPA